MTQYYETLAAAIREIDPATARRDLQTTDAEIARQLSEVVGVQVSPRCEFVRMTRLALQLAARRQ